jgi:hypothetical protein
MLILGYSGVVVKPNAYFSAIHKQMFCLFMFHILNNKNSPFSSKPEGYKHCKPILLLEHI